MWDEEKQRRFDVLREREASETLGTDEQAELDAMLAELDAEEAAAMQPALERAQERIEALSAELTEARKRQAELARIAEEQERLLAEARSYAERLRTRRAALEVAFRRIVGRTDSNAA